MNMKRSVIILVLVLAAFLPGCRKDNDPDFSGTFTIDNTLYGTGPYYAMGFSFSLAKELSTLADPGPDMTLIADVDIDGTIRRLLLQTENYKNSFFKYGVYQDAASASAAFKNLTSASVSTWDEWGDTIEPNQIWIFRTDSEHYVKFRIISTVAEKRNSTAFASCTFEWVYQPDGTPTFPGK
jgi:hypothetical protein